MRVRRLRKEVAHLEITAFINLIVVLVPFLLSTAVFTRLAVLDMKLPAQSSGAVQQIDGKLKLEVIIRPDAIEVNDRIGGRLFERIPKGANGHDLKLLSERMAQLKTQFPDVMNATVLAEQDTPYDTLIQVMDAVREKVVAQGSHYVRSELFPDISIGDAPVVRK
jgi:biopolymer transport protein ExbD